MQIPSILTEQLPAAHKACRLVALLSILTVTSASCELSFQANQLKSKAEVTPTPSPSIDPTSICERVRDIKMLPMKDEPVADPAYNALLQTGEKAIPCLIRAITDTTEMADPRMAPKVGTVRVGDVAYFLLVEFANLDFVELLPAEARKKYATDGVYGYFEYIGENNKRQELQEAAYDWYEKKYNRNLRIQ